MAFKYSCWLNVKTDEKVLRTKSDIGGIKWSGRLKNLAARSSIEKVGQLANPTERNIMKY